ncbi:hypothetical protein [Rhodanobacter sp. A1T4]|jgi:hypothetical protein|uniref:hypothetical protein n=1 Tax=Rhodanobacter sp. A1T4 TaxID=2723087 RepID=UPI00161C80CF|nr:hypothetical protein [Rhodanobacter sp. A1T4]MBB6245823.1 hypothetical protein [Rhodanobacter sp. A1T4]
MRDWRVRADTEASLAFRCELGPYISGAADHTNLSDRWKDALQVRELALAVSANQRAGSTSHNSLS